MEEISVTVWSWWRWKLALGRPWGWGATWPDLAHPSPVEPLSGNLVEKNCSVWCTPMNNQQGQVSKGQETTLCCNSDLCNEALQSWQSAAPARTSAHLGLALACGLLALLWAPGL